MSAVAAPASHPVDLAPSRITPADLVREGTSGLRSRRARTVLTAVGIGIGIAAMVAVLGIAESSRAGLLAQLDRLGTNLLTVSPGQRLFGGTATLPLAAPAMVDRIGPVQATSATAPVSGSVYKTDLIPRVQSGGLSVVATQTSLLDTLRGSLADGVFLNGATAQYPAVVLGADAATYLGITSVADGVQIYLGRSWFTVVGILEPFDPGARAGPIGADRLPDRRVDVRHRRRGGHDLHPDRSEPGRRRRVGPRRHRQPREPQ